MALLVLIYHLQPAVEMVTGGAGFGYILSWGFLWRFLVLVVSTGKLVGGRIWKYLLLVLKQLLE